MMQKLVTLFTALCLVALTGNTFAQDIHRICGTDDPDHPRFANVPNYQREMQRAERLYLDYLEHPEMHNQRVVKKIPVVVHIIQATAAAEVTDADVYSQLDVLNEDFRKIAGTAGDGNGVDTEYEFCLATIDPNGCPTTGINRIINPSLADHSKDDENLLKGLIQWNPDMYLNVWVPRTITSTGGSGGGLVIGYATLPQWITFQRQLDGIVIAGDFFGRNSNPLYIGRTTTHEVGHWMGLYHTFQFGCSGSSSSNCNSAGDNVCDTPQAAAANFGCPNVNTCVDSPVDDPDQIENYMDYANGTCQDMFTLGQKNRMDIFYQTYRSGLGSPANQTATGCDGTTSAGCAPTADFTADAVRTCVGQSVIFSDLSSGPPTSWSWTFQGGTPATSTDQIPVVTWNSPGVYNVTLEVTNSLGTNTETRAAYISVTDPVNPPLVEGFESIFILPQNWYTEDLGGSLNWSRSNNAASEGNWSMFLDLYQGDANTFYNMNTTPYDLSGVTTADLSFDYSYKRYNAFTFDTLAIRTSTDCGATWHTLWQQGGNPLTTVLGNTLNSGWVPTDTSHWRTINISIPDSLLGSSGTRYQFRAISGGGQNIWLDNINMSTVVSTDDPFATNWGVRVFPNPFQDAPQINYELSVNTKVDFVLTDVRGQILHRQSTGAQGAGTHTLQLDEETYNRLAPGIYFLKAQSDLGQVTHKLIKMAH